MRQLLSIAGIVLLLAICSCGPSEESQPEPAKPERTSPKAPKTPEAESRETQTSAEAPASSPAKVETAMEQGAKETAVAETVTETAEKATSATTTESSAVVEEAKAKAAEEAATGTPTVQAPDTIILEASYGKITFPHAMHAESYECALCHAGAPGPFDQTKEVAHLLCKGCHKEQDAGPTGCKGCHQKG